MIAGGALLFCVGFLAGRWFFPERIFYQSIRDLDSGYEYIAPLLFVAIGEEQSFPRYRPLKDALQNFVERVQEEGRAESVSIYFRDLNTSQWVAANIDERYTPASMLKVATLMAVLSAAEEDPALLNRRVRVGTSEDSQPTQAHYPPRNPVKVGSAYSVEELLRRLTKESDNLADRALVGVVGEERVRGVYEELALPLPEVGKEKGYTVEEYSRLFRTLYNSTSLSRPFSEFALALLSDTNFTEGIVRGVPDGVNVAHKFGVHTTISDPGTREERIHHELHDCGIVYAKENPYFICVMTRGANFDALESALKEASKLIFEEVNAS